MSQSHTIGRTATTVANDGEYTVVTYHATPVVKFNERQIVLNSGGWTTNTTKLRMNQTANQFNLGYRVHQESFDWFVQYKGKNLPFEDGITLTR